MLSNFINLNSNKKVKGNLRTYTHITPRWLNNSRIFIGMNLIVNTISQYFRAVDEGRDFSDDEMNHQPILFSSCWRVEFCRSGLEGEDEKWNELKNLFTAWRNVRDVRVHYEYTEKMINNIHSLYHEISSPHNCHRDILSTAWRLLLRDDEWLSM